MKICEDCSRWIEPSTVLDVQMLAFFWNLELISILKSVIVEIGGQHWEVSSLDKASGPTQVCTSCSHTPFIAPCLIVFQTRIKLPRSYNSFHAIHQITEWKPKNRINFKVLCSVMYCKVMCGLTVGYVFRVTNVQGCDDAIGMRSQINMWKGHSEVGSKTSGGKRRRASRTVFHALAAPTMETLWADWLFAMRFPGTSSW